MNLQKETLEGEMMTPLELCLDFFLLLSNRRYEIDGCCCSI